MKIFLSWSGPRSRAAAEALSTWIPRVIQAVDVFFSPEIEKGAKWGNEITGALEGTSFGIVVITRDNLTSPWLHYEAGALSKLPGARVWTFLLDLPNADVAPPLGLFQHTEATQEDVLKLLRSINAQVRDGGGKALGETALTETFEDLWPRFRGQIDIARDLDASRAQTSSGVADARSVSDKVDEVLELLRAAQRNATRERTASLLALESVIDPPLDFDESAIREAARRAATSTSLRQVAHAAGISPTGLRSFLEGRNPHHNTLRRLSRWMHAHQANEGGELLSAEAARAAVRMLLHGVPDAAVDGQRRQIMEELQRGYHESGIPEPAWVAELMDEQ